MSWFGGGLSNIQGKLTSFTAQVLNDVVETVQGSVDEDPNEEAGSTTVPLDDFIELKTQYDNLTKRNHELESQIATLSRQYRDLLGSSKGQSNAPGLVNEATHGEIENFSQNPWWSELEKWLNSQGLSLPQTLIDQIIRNQINQEDSTTKQIEAADEDQRKKCQFLEQRIASLEEELESLDQEHQSALDVALSTRDQLKEENHQLSLRLSELEKEAEHFKVLATKPNDIEEKITENGSTIPESLSESTPIESYRELTEELEKHKESLSTLSAKLSVLESVQRQNDELHLQLNQLNETISELTLTHKAAETKLAQENDELHAKVGALTSQNQILSSMTSVLDRITEENRVLEGSLETVGNELKAKIAEINQLREEMATNSSSALPVSPMEEKSTETEVDFDHAKTQELNDENERLKKKMAELEKAVEDYESCKLNLNQMSECLMSLKTELSAIQEALASSELRIENLTSENLRLVQNLEGTPPNAENENSVAEMANSLESLKDENSALRHKIETLEIAHSNANSQLNSLTEARLNLETELVQTRDEVQRFRLNNTELEAANPIKEAELNALQSDLLAHQATQSLKHDLDKAEENRILLCEQLSSLKLQYEEKMRQNASNKEEITAKVDFYVQEVDKISQENAELKSRIEGLSVEKARIEEQADCEKKALLEQLKTVNDAMEQSKSAEEANQRACEKLTGELEEMRAQLCNAQKKAEEYLINTEQQSKEIGKLNSEALQLRGALATAEKSSAELEIRNEELQRLYESQTKIVDELSCTLETVRQKYDSLIEEKQNGSEYGNEALELSRALTQKEEELTGLKQSFESLISERDQFAAQLQETNKERELLRETIQAFQQQREQIVQTVQQKHQEAINYHTETLRLAKICEDLQAKLNEKSTLEHEVHQLHTENEALKANQGQWEAEMERLRSHLLSVEEMYTQELLNCQSKEKVLRDSLQASEERASEQSRLGDQLSGWQEKYRKALAEKDRLEKEKLGQERSLERLQHALEQLTREKERDIIVAQKELLLKLAKAESVQNEKEAELITLRRKLGEAQQGLDAASRLTHQLDKTKEALAAANEQVSNQDKELLRVRQQMEKLQAGTDAKVDKSLVKNLLIGYFSAPSAKQKQEVLRIVATVMDFSPEDRHKTGVEDSPVGLTGWASGILKSRTRTSSGSSSVGDADKSLSEAFISFLESESARPSPPRLPVQQPGQNSPAVKATTSMGSFQPGRNEPTILRDVLRDSEN